MRLSTRLVLNAVTSFLRLGTTFLLGIFLTWYMVDEVGLIGFGMVSLTLGMFGMSAIDAAIRASVIRELSAAIGTGQRSEIQGVLASALAFCGLVALGLIAFFCAVAACAWLGVFNTPAEHPRLPGVLALLFLAEGAAISVRMLLSPYTQSIFASQRTGLDNALMTLDRAVAVAAAVVAFGVLWPERDLAGKLAGYAWVRLLFLVGQNVLEVAVARRLIPDLRFRRAAFSRSRFDAVAGTVWHTGQMRLLQGASPQFVMVIVNLFFGLAFNGVWGIATQVGGHVAMIAGGLLRGIDPISTHLKDKGQRRAIVNLMIRGVRYQLLGTLPVACAYALFLTPILHLWVGGRLAEDADLAAAGVTVGAAIGMTAVMGTILIVAQTLRMSTAGMERMLYGLGEIRSYAWFAKYSVLITVAGAALLMAIFDTPAVAPVPFVIANFLFAIVVIPRAAARRADLPIGETLRRSVPRPLIATAVFLVPLIVARTRIDTLTLRQLVILLAACGVMAAPLVYAIGFDAEERARLRHLLATALRRGRRAAASGAGGGE